VVLETTEEQTLVLTSRVVGNTSIQQMYTLGIRPERYKVVVAKGVLSPRPAYAPIASQLILVDTPGITTADLSRFSYHWRRRPLYPFEAEHGICAQGTGVGRREFRIAVTWRLPCHLKPYRASPVSSPATFPAPTPTSS